MSSTSTSNISGNEINSAFLMPRRTHQIGDSICVSHTYPPPIVIIDASAAMNSSEPCPKPLSPSMPTHGYLARSGYSENKNVSPVPKYACRCPLSSFRFRSNQRVEQYAPNTYSIQPHRNRNKKKIY